MNAQFRPDDPSSAQIRESRDAVEFSWLKRTKAEDVLNEMLIDHEEQLDMLFEANNFEGDPLAIGRYVLAIRKALSLLYARLWGEA